MAIYTYVKAKPKVLKRKLDILSYSLMTIGAMFLFWSFYPIISFEIYSRLFIQNKFFSPVPSSKITSSMEQANSVLGAYNVVSTNLSSYTNAGVWFPNKPQENKKKLDISTYYLSIPKLNIRDAKVVVGGDDLTTSLIHYLPSSLPGQMGNVNIFGHSTLPQLYDPKNYKTIFTYLPSIERGDQIIVKVNDISYSYSVYDMFVINPDQVSVLDQRYDNSYLTLITCVPPGTFWKRLVVRAKLERM